MYIDAWRSVALILVLCLGVAVSSSEPGVAAPDLYDRPVLVVDPGMHTALIKSGAVASDVAGRWAVTGSADKTIRVWSLADGALLRTIRMPTGLGDIGKVYSVAMSPDGTLIAAGGWTRWTSADRQEQIYLFDRETGAMVRRIDGLPNVVTHLAFSPDGALLAATFSSGGLRVYKRDFTELFADGDYGDASYGADFARDGRLVTTSLDGKIRLYASGGTGNVQPVFVLTSPSGRQPFGVAFSPDNDQIAVGYHDAAAVDLLDARSFYTVPGLDLSGLDNGDLSNVAWSRDGHILFAAGSYGSADGTMVLAWRAAPKGWSRRAFPARQGVVSSLVPLSNGDLLVCTTDPWLARFQPSGDLRWSRLPPLVDFRNQYNRLLVSSDGEIIGFDFPAPAKAEARFDLRSRVITIGGTLDRQLTAPRQNGLPVNGWRNTGQPKLEGRPLRLAPYEISRSLAIHPNGDLFVLGTDWSIRAFDARGEPIWVRSVTSAVWAVNITANGRLLAAAQDDGTIRWYRMSDGVELLAFMPFPDRFNWAAWTPESFYSATAGAHGTLRWIVNHGWDDSAESVPADEIPGAYRPDILPLVLQELETPRALGLAELAAHKRSIMIRTSSQLPPGASLRVLAVGIAQYNADQAGPLQIRYSAKDARDIASVLNDTQGVLYARVTSQVLLDQDATKANILRSFAALRAEIEHSDGGDLVVVYFSCRGTSIDGTVYLLPYDVDARDSIGLKTTALSVDQIRAGLLELARFSRVLVLIDAAHSGAITAAGSALPMDSTVLRSALAAPNVTVFTSSSGTGLSQEDLNWQHGAFTKALLDALSDPAADLRHNGLISATELGIYIARDVAALTGGKQTPGIEIRYDGTVFASGL